MSVPDALNIPGVGGGTYVPVHSYNQTRYTDGTILLRWTSGDLSPGPRNSHLRAIGLNSPGPVP